MLLLRILCCIVQYVGYMRPFICDAVLTSEVKLHGLDFFEESFCAYTIFLNLMLFPIIFTTYGKSPWKRDQPFARPVPSQDNTTQIDLEQTSMP
jgi:hypothetical protein